MPSRKKVNESKTQAADVLYQNKFTQTILLVGARKTYLELGRGSAKTTEAIVSTLLELIYEMPGAPIVWVADTFANLTANILPSAGIHRQRERGSSGLAKASLLEAGQSHCFLQANHRVLHWPEHFIWLHGSAVHPGRPVLGVCLRG